MSDNSLFANRWTVSTPSCDLQLRQRSERKNGLEPSCHAIPKIREEAKTEMIDAFSNVRYEVYIKNYEVK